MTTLEAIDTRIARIERMLGDVIERMAVGHADDDDWRRMPSHPARCKISGWSRTTLWQHCRSGSVRSKMVNNCRFYAGSDVRKLLSAQPT